MSDFANTLLLGLIEGITEFLPVSSTGHLLVAEHWLGARSDLFNIVIQAGAILAVCLIYRQRLWQLATQLGQPEERTYALKLCVAFGITAVLGLAVAKLGFKLPERVTPVAWALILGGMPLPSSMRVEVEPGRTAHVMMPVPLSSSARLFMKPTSPHFDAQYAARRGVPSVEEMLPTCTMRPRAFLRMAGRTARVSRNGARRFTASVSSQTSGRVSSTETRGAMPPLFTSTSSAGNCESTAYAAASTDATPSRSRFRGGCGTTVPIC